MGLAPQLVKELFLLSTHAYNLRSTYQFKIESLSFLGPKIWELVPLEIKFSHSLQELRKQKKQKNK